MHYEKNKFGFLDATVSHFVQNCVLIFLIKGQGTVVKK